MVNYNTGSTDSNRVPVCNKFRYIRPILTDDERFRHVFKYIFFYSATLQKRVISNAKTFLPYLHAAFLTSGWF